MPIFIWVIATVCVLVFIACIIWLTWAVRLPSEDFVELPKLAHVGGSILIGVVAIAAVVGSMFWLYGTAPGQRELKSFGSEVGGGLTRVVTVYDLQGEVIDTYEGTFDIQTDSSRVFFDIPQDDGSSRRVQIYNATVIVEEQ